MTLDPQIEPTLKEMMASDVFDRAVFTSEPDWESVDENEEATPPVSNAERIARPVTDDERAAMRADLEPLVKPLMNALASALQGEGKELPALNFDQITDDVMKGTAVEAAILGQMGEGVLSGLGLSPDEITELLAQATREPETPPAS